MKEYILSHRLLRKDSMVFSMYVVVGFLLRFSAFFQAAVDWDEGVYLLMARSLLEGHPLYTEVWANTPPGIYLVYALAQIALGDSILSIRIASWVASSITCYLLYRLGIVIGNGQRGLGIVAGLLYVVFSLNSQGLAANTEIFFTPLVVLAFLLLLSRDAYPRKLFAHSSFVFLTVGLLLGTAFEIKYVVIFDFLAILLIASSKLYLQEKANRVVVSKRILLCSILLGVGFALPFLLVSLYFFVGDHFDVYLHTNLVANVIHSTDTQFSIVRFLTMLSREVLNNSLLWVCLLLTPVYLVVFRGAERSTRQNLIALLVWFAIASLGVGYTKLFYPHYFLQLLPPLCLIGAFVIYRTIGYGQVDDDRRRYFLLALVVLGPLAMSATVPLGRSAIYAYQRYVKGAEDWGDEPAVVAGYLEDRVESDDYIYAVDYPPVLYYLSPGRIPTKYVFPLFLTDEHFSRLAGVDPGQEPESIMRKEPAYVIKQYAPDDQF